MFQPSPISTGETSDYGICLAIFDRKRRCRDKALRAAERKEDRAKKAAAKGKTAKAERILGRAAKKRAKAAKFGAKLEAKGKTTRKIRTTTSIDAEGNLIGKAGTAMAAGEEMLDTGMDEGMDAGMDEGYGEEEGGSGMGMILFGVLGLAAIGGGAYFMLRKS